MKKYCLFSILILFAVFSRGADVCYAAENTITVPSSFPSPHAYVQTLRFNAHEEPSGSCDIGRVFMNTAGDIQICQDDGFSVGVYNGLGGVWKQSGNSLYPSATATNSSPKVGIGTTAPAERLHLKDGNFLASKEYSGSTNNSLLYFDATKGALMTGRKSSLALTSLSTLSLGIGSLSVGLDSTASGNYALAVGNQATASGTNSVAIGRNASAQGNNSVVINLADSSSSVGTTQANTMTILGGKVGIGVANPTYHLELPSVAYSPTVSATPVTQTYQQWHPPTYRTDGHQYMPGHGTLLSNFSGRMRQIVDFGVQQGFFTIHSYGVKPPTVYIGYFSPGPNPSLSPLISSINTFAGSDTAQFWAIMGYPNGYWLAQTTETSPGYYTTETTTTTQNSYSGLANCSQSLLSLYPVVAEQNAVTINGAAMTLEDMAQLTLCHMFGGMRDSAVALTPNVSAMTGLARASSWHAYSDGRFKTNLQPIENAMDLVERLNPVYYNWVIHYTDSEGHLRNSSSVMKTRDIGLIAQDVYKVIPEIVHKPDDESTSEWSLDYARLTPVLIQALKEQATETKTLYADREADIAALRDELNALKEELKQPSNAH